MRDEEPRLRGVGGAAAGATRVGEAGQPPRARDVAPGATDARATLAWALTATVGVLAAAFWLREPGVPYLAVCAAATALGLVLARRHPVRARRLWATPCVAMLAVFVVGVAPTQWTLRRIDADWPAYSESVQQRGSALLASSLERVGSDLTSRAERALDAPDAPRAAFAALQRLVRDGREESVVLYRGGSPAAWSGRLRVPPDSTTRPFSASSNGFYVTLQATATRGARRAIATDVLHTEPPADRLAQSLDARVARRAGVRGFDFLPPSAADSADGSGARVVFAPGGRPLFVAVPRALQRGEARLRAVEDGRSRGAPLLAVAIAFLVAALWRRPAPLRRRLGALAAVLAVVALVPLNAFSNASRFFDPSFYFAPLGGPFTGSAAALGLTSAVVLLGLLAVLRSPIPVRSRWPALIVILVVAGVGPFLLRDLARGIVLPPWGSSLVLWLAWEVTLFLAATSVLLAGASAGRAALGARRGVSPWVAPAVAAAAALLAPVLFDAPGRWPPWYPVLWVAAIGALALTRRARGFVLTAATVAGFGAATLVWGATVRKRVELAQRDVAGLSAFDPYARTLLERFALQLASDDPPLTRADLLQSYVAADLAAAGFPVALTSWTADGTPAAELTTAPVEERPQDLAALTEEARRTGAPTIRQAPGAAGVELQLGVPHAGGRVTTVVVGPRTLLLTADDPSASLLGLDPESSSEPPYALSLVPTDPRAPMSSLTPGADDRRWRREGDELHGDWIVRTADGPMRAHVEVELRSLSALVERGTLVVLLDLAVVAVLWTLAALADGGLGRWLRARQRVWGRSFRARLTFVLFGFFIAPSIVFVVWSYRRLQADDRQSRELLVRETLRAVAMTDDPARLALDAERLGTPLLLYSGGVMRAASDTLYDALAPVGRLLPPEVQLRVGLGEEVTASRVEPVGRSGTLFGYVPARRPAGERVVLAAPARTSELALDQRRRDLGVLVLFAAALGALGALGLSGVAARQLSRPIGTLRAAALAVARGDSEPVPPGEPPTEFVPVFSAFRRMAADLRASQSALEEAQRRTAAVLRNVASGVVAVGADCRIVLANPRAALLLECDLSPGTPLECIGSPEIEGRVRAFASATAEEEEEFDVELERRQLHGRLTRLSMGDGAPVVLTLDDVTELARAQRVLAWGEMARQIAHEIKNPLTPIRLGVQHLRRARQNPRVDFDAVLEQNVSRILAEIDRLDEIARAFSRYGTAPAERPPTEPTDVAAVVRDVVALERLGQDEATSAQVEWEVSGADQTSRAEAREDELREVLLNVLENARLANARHVRARLERDEPAGLVRVVVTDDGEGIASDVLSKVFEPHFSTRTSGSGLGLAISRRIIDGWGGSIDLASERGVGTTVTIALRLSADGAGPAAA